LTNRRIVQRSSHDRCALARNQRFMTQSHSRSPVCRHTGGDRSTGSDCLAGPNQEAGQAAHGPRVGEIAAQGQPQGLRWLPSSNTCVSNAIFKLLASFDAMAHKFRLPCPHRLAITTLFVLSDSVALQAPPRDARLVRAQRPPRGPGRRCRHPSGQDGGRSWYEKPPCLTFAAPLRVKRLRFAVH
jgi:hypothetical protein